MRLKELREQLGLTQKQMAEMANCQQKAYPVAYIPLFFVPHQHK